MDESNKESGTPQQKIFITSKSLPQIEYWKPGESYEIKATLRLVQIIDLIRDKQGVFTIEKVEENVEMPDMSSMDNPTFQRYTSEVKRKGTL